MASRPRSKPRDVATGVKDSSKESSNITDYVFGVDVLSATKFKPWWETLRAWAVFGLFVDAILIIYTMNPATSLTCVSIGNESKSFDELGESNVNLHCAKFSPGSWFFANVGYFAFAACIVIQLLFSWWLFVPRVRFTFRSLKKYDDKCDKLELVVNEINSIRKKHGMRVSEDDLAEWKGSLEEQQELNEDLTSMIEEMNEYETRMPFAVPTIYAIRNFLILIVLTVNLYVLYFIMHVREPPFSCAFQNIKAECQYDVIEQLLPFVIFGTVLLAFIGLICVVTVIGTACCNRDVPERLEDLTRKSDYAFAVSFANNSTPLSRTADTLLKGLAGQILNPAKSRKGSKRGPEKGKPSKPDEETEPLIAR